MDMRETLAERIEGFAPSRRETFEAIQKEVREQFILVLPGWIAKTDRGGSANGDMREIVGSLQETSD